MAEAYLRYVLHTAHYRIGLESVPLPPPDQQVMSAAAAQGVVDDGYQLAVGDDFRLLQEACFFLLGVKEGLSKFGDVASEFDFEAVLGSDLFGGGGIESE